MLFTKADIEAAANDAQYTATQRAQFRALIPAAEAADAYHALPATAKAQERADACDAVLRHMHVPIVMLNPSAFVTKLAADWDTWYVFHTSNAKRDSKR